MKVAKRTWEKPVTIKADGATVRGLTLDGVNGLHWKGGTFRASGGMTGSAASGYAVRITKSANVSILGATFTDAVRGLVAGDSKGLLVAGNHFVGLRSDGINLAAMTATQVLGNHFRDFTPNRRRCLHNGTIELDTAKRDCAGIWTDGDHADAIQMWGDTDDVLIRGNDIAGRMQAIGFFGRVGDKRSRIYIENNVAASTSGWGISLQDCADCSVIGNHLSRYKGGTMKQKIVVTGSTGSFCGNVNPDASLSHPTARPCGETH